MTARPNVTASHIRCVAGAWLLYAALLVVLPIDYGRLEALQTSFALATFAVLSLTVAVITDWLTVGSPRRPHASTQVLRIMHPARARQLVLISLALGFGGFLALVVDKIFVQRIDFTQGIAVARYLWRNEAEARSGGVSSLFSVVGYLIGFSFFATAAIAHLHWESLSKGVRRLALLGVVFLVMANSFLTGGRSIILVQIAAFVATGAIRALGRRGFFPGKSLRALTWASVLLVIAIGYSVYVFSERANANGVEPEVYTVAMLGYLGATPTESFEMIEKMPEGLSGIAQFCVIAGAYITHSWGTFQSLIELDSTPGNASFVFARVLLTRFGLLEPIEDEWLLTGRFPSLPGALWYDFGWAGVVGGALCVGFLLGLVRPLLAVRPFAATAIGLVLAIVITGLLAPLLLAPDLLAFPFMIISFLVVDFIAWLLQIRSSWLPAGHVRSGSIKRVSNP